MAGRTLTAANSLLFISVDRLFPIAQRLQGFSADDVFDTESVDPAEISMGVDGKLSAGWVPVAIRQNITLQADSASIDMFEMWYGQQQTLREILYASGNVSLPATGRKYSLVRGVLSSHAPTPSAKKVLQPRKFTITWEKVTGGAA